MDVRDMTAVILAGGKGTRISEESVLRPKPLVAIGGKPILWHIMKIYASFGVHKFIICCGYKGEAIKKYFLNFNLENGDTEFWLNKEGIQTKTEPEDDWDVILVNTGLNTKTAGRILKIKNYIDSDDEFFLTYGDGVADIDLNKLLDFHHRSGKTVTISTTQPEGRFGAIKISDDGIVESFSEKARRNQSFVNIGFMIMTRKVWDYFGDGTEMLEKGPFEALVRKKQMTAYRHLGFWSPMDNVNDKAYLESLWKNGAPWKIWEEN